MSSGHKALSYAFLIGMPRAATTYLYHNLSSHPNICVPYKRKTNYFSLHMHKGDSWFRDNFKPVESEYVGVDTETLSFLDSSLKGHSNIASHYSSSRAVLIVRNPEKWVVSLYKQIRTFDRKIVSFENFVKGEYVLVEDDVSLPFSYCDGDLEKIISRAKREFLGRLLIVDFRELAVDPVRFLKEIEGFLGVGQYFEDSTVIHKKINSSDRKGSLIMNVLMRSTLFSRIVRALFPAALILSIRKRLDHRYSDVVDNELEKDDFDFVVGRFPRDTQYIDGLFETKGYIEC